MIHRTFIERNVLNNANLWHANLNENRRLFRFKIKLIMTFELAIGISIFNGESQSRDIKILSIYVSKFFYYCSFWVPRQLIFPSN